MVSNASAKKGFELTSGAIKWIALISMFCDHFSKAVLQALIDAPEFMGAAGGLFQSDGFAAFCLGLTYFGRIAFVLYIFLLVEGFFHTRNLWKYLCRIGIFVFISEIPFDLAFRIRHLEPAAGKILEFGYQNVMLTLVLGLLGMILCEKILARAGNDRVGVREAVPVMAVMAGCVFAGWALKSDYNAAGVAAIFVGWLIQLYLPRMTGASQQTARMMAVVGIVVPLLLLSEVEAFGFLALIPVAFYRGRKSRRSSGPASGLQKWFFYAFYPGHLLLLVLIRALLLT